MKMPQENEIQTEEEFLQDSKEEVLTSAIKFMADLLSLWNKRNEENGTPDNKITKEDLYEELKKDVYEI